jgi:hypothetical protein
MKPMLPRRHLLALAGWAGLWLTGLDKASATTALPGTPAAALPGARLVGEGLLRVWGFQVYRSRLWALPGFQATDYAEQPLALELEYLRAFRGADIARRSIEEMRGIGAFSVAQAERWERALAGVLPDVSPGDRLLGVHRPGQGARFYAAGQALGTIDDPQFSRLFFGIWLDPNTSAPALRQALLGS